MRKVVLTVATVVVALVVGSFLYWQADGSAGTPGDFRQRVGATGLEVSWTNAGPRGGDGVVQTDCGPVEVTVNEINDVLWATVNDARRPLNAATVRAIESCPSG